MTGDIGKIIIATCHGMQSSSASTENSDAANSAQILVAVEAKSKAKVKPKAKKKQAVQGSAADK